LDAFSSVKGRGLLVGGGGTEKNVLLNIAVSQTHIEIVCLNVVCVCVCVRMWVRVYSNYPAISHFG